MDEDRTLEQPARWRRVQQVFAAALERPTAERPAFLVEACGGDQELRREVDTLLASHAKGSALEGAARGGVKLGDEAPMVRTIGKYEVLAKIGQGGFGTVFQGRDPLLQRTVAIKTCTNEDSELRRRFFREARIAAALQHPNVTTVHDFGLEGEVPYLVQEYLPGRDLKDIIADDELSAWEKLDLLIQAARGLEYAHGQGVVHRDVKPANVRVLESGDVKIMDFGIARLLSGDTQLTGTGMALGTVGYLAPEQLRGETVDERADIFAFGVMAYELFMGKGPFRGETFAQISLKILQWDPPLLMEAWSECPSLTLSEIVQRCLSKDPKDRYGSMGMVRSALEEVRAGFHLPAVSVKDTSTLVERPPVVEARSRTVWYAAGAALLVVAALSGWYLGGRGGEPPPAPVPSGGPAPAAVLLPPTPAAPREPAAKPETEPVPPPPSVDAASAVAAAPDPGKEPPARPAPPPPEAAPQSPVLRTEARAKSEEEEPPPPRAAPPPPPVLPPSPAAAPPSVSPEPAAAPPEPSIKLGDVIVSGPGVVAPELVEKAPAVYPSRARRRQREADVVVAVYVDERGSVVQAILKKRDGTNYGFDDAALEAAKLSRFRPATRDGVAGKMWTEIAYEFRLNR